MKIELNPIGSIHTPYKSLEGMPIQSRGARGVKGTVEVFEKYREGLNDLEGFSHVVLLYHFHKNTDYKLTVVPFLDSKPRGLFATRAPKRPNPIGLTIVELERIENGILYISNVDMLDGTPLLDIKPHVPFFDDQKEVRIGWLEEVGKNASDKRSDGRFT
ncbi:MAG: tRNA (N6-threonylcarbamoyladenosine(37)-N6)-methyltransferase TrmO [Bacteroidales bacterium]|nr:tRNA (N6-threonylcarbamoyladenosine(37)-N6)-methyltransferase TrmO [Bacteroidales bacterium]